MDKVLADITQAIADAEQKQIARLKELYPKGKGCQVMLMSGQIAPSLGRIEGYEASRYGGYVRVRMVYAKAGSRQPYRNIHPNSIVWVEA